MLLLDTGKGGRKAQVQVSAPSHWQGAQGSVHALAWARDGRALAAAWGDGVQVLGRSLRGQTGPGWLLPLDWADMYT